MTARKRVPRAPADDTRVHATKTVQRQRAAVRRVGNPPGALLRAADPPVRGGPRERPAEAVSADAEVAPDGHEHDPHTVHPAADHDAVDRDTVDQEPDRHAAGHGATADPDAESTARLAELEADLVRAVAEFGKLIEVHVEPPPERVIEAPEQAHPVPDAAPDLVFEPAPDLAPEPAPDLVSEPAPDLAPEAVPDPPEPPPLDPAPAAATPATRPATAATAAGSRRPLWVAIAAVLALVVAGAVVLATHHSGHRTTATRPTTPVPSTPPKPTAAQLSLEAWAKANLSTDAVIVADPTTAQALGSAGFTRAVADTALAGVNWRGVDYVVTGSPAATVSAVRNTLQDSSAVVAVFGTGTARMSVRQVFSGGTAQLLARERVDRVSRLQAGRELSVNRSLTFAAPVRAVVTKGALDLRAATVLTLLAQQGGVYVRSAPIDPAEAAAGLPVRTITVKAADAQAAADILQNLPVAYHPASVVVVAQGTYQITWAVAIASALPIQ